MASSVFYKFKSQRDESRVNFDGTGISVFDLKKEIILANNLGKANDFDLVILDPSSNEEYKDDSHVIPRSSSVVVKRVFAKPGKGKAAMYIAGASTGSSTATSDPSKAGQGANGSYAWHRGNISKRFDGKEEPSSSASKPTAPTPVIKPSVITKDDEAAAMAAMFQAQNANWEETQEKMSQAQRIYSNPRGGGPGRGGKPFQHHHIDRPLPPSYVCYRCGQKGHWIQDCPTNNDRDYDHRPRIKRTTGIPRSFLKAVENPSTGPIGHGVMVTPEGGYVVAQPDVASWQKQVQKPKGLTEAEVRERTPSDPSLVCPIDNKLFRDAVKTPCCGTLYCEECIQTHLLERDFVCPHCAAKIASLDKLVIDKPTRTKVLDYIDKEIEKSRNESQGETAERSSTPAAGGDKPAEGSGEQPQQDQDYYGEQQPGVDFDMSQMVAATIPQLQAQIQQLNMMLNNPSLPPDVRRQTEMKYQQLQMELQQAQIASALIQQASSAVAAANAMPMQQMPQQYMQPQQQQWSTNPFSNQQPAGQDSAYQRLPLNNRRRNLKRERPSDFLEVAGESEAKVPRYWE